MTKRITAILIVLLLLSSLATHADESVIKIYTRQELEEIAANVNALSEDYTGKTVRLMNNIALTGDWIPIGYDDESGMNFNGTFEGSGYTISNLYISSDKYMNAGLFGVISGDAVIKNVQVNGKIYSTYYKAKTTTTAAGIAGWLNKGTVTDCRASMDITINHLNAPQGQGINAAAGGISGIVNIATIENCAATGIFNMEQFNETDGIFSVGGIAGLGFGGNIKNCVADTQINYDSGYQRFVGGVVGYAIFFSNINGCYASGGTGNNPAVRGGLCGAVEYSTIINSATSFAASKESGLVLGANSSDITNCGWLGENAGRAIYEGNNITSSDITSFDQEALANKIVVGALPDKFALNVTEENSGTISLATFPAAKADNLQSVTLTCTPADLATVAANTANSYTVKTHLAGSGVLGFTAQLSPTAFKGNLEEKATAVDLSTSTPFNVHEKSSSSGCNAGTAAIIALLAIPAVIFRRKK